MIVRSLRWRLVLAMILVIAAAAIGNAVFSTMTVRREFERFLVSQRLDDTRTAMQLYREHELHEAMRLTYEQHHFRSVALQGDRVIAVHPAELSAYRITPFPDGLELTRGDEKLRVQGMFIRVGDTRVHLLPPHEASPDPPREFRMNVNRWLIAGFGAAALLAVLVMLTIFRRVFRPVEVLTAGAQSLAAGKLDTRVDVRGDDEVALLGRAFNAMAEALERNERARRGMVSDVAHELRTPLTSIRVQIEAVQDGVVAPDAKWIASIEEDAAALARLVDDLQQLSLADAGVLRLELEDAGVHELLERALSGLQREGIAIARDVPPGLVVRADARRLVQVVRNLVVNALAHASSSIAISATRSGDVIEIRVADDGPGVPDEQAERIFDRFYRADPSRARSTGGAGLGLAIARQLVELHGGTIRYERPSFVVRLPSSDLHR